MLFKHKIMTKTSWKKLFIVVATVAIILPGGVFASNQVSSGNSNVVVNKDQTIDGNYYAVASNVEIKGHVKGDLICAGETVTVSGNIDGDIICAAQIIDVTGTVGGSVRLLARNATIASPVLRNITVVAGALYLSPKADVGMDTVFLADKFNTLGNINGNVFGAAEQVYLGGKIGESVNLKMNDSTDDTTNTPLVILQTAKIDGDLTYEAVSDAKIEKRETIKGQIIKNVSQGSWQDGVWGSVGSLWLWSKIAAVLSAMIIGLMFVIFFRKQTVIMSDKMVESPKRNILWGILILALTPLICLFLLVTLIGIPVAIILMMLWIITVMVAKPLAAIMVGHVIMGRYKHKQKTKKRPEPVNPYTSMLLGVVVTYALLSIPFVGVILAYILASWTVGTITLMFKELRLKE